MPFSQFISCVAHRSADRPRVIPSRNPTWRRSFRASGFGMERRTQRVRSPRAKCSFVQRGWWPQAARATAGEGRYDQILKCSERSTQQIRYRPTGPQAPWDRIRANADNRKASRISLFVSKTVAGEPQGEDATVLLINIYRTSVSGVFRRKDFWFRGLWRKPGQRFAVCGGNPAFKQDAAVALQKRAPANEPEGNSA